MQWCVVLSLSPHMCCKSGKASFWLSWLFPYFFLVPDWKLYTCHFRSWKTQMCQVENKNKLKTYIVFRFFSTLWCSCTHIFLYLFILYSRPLYKTSYVMNTISTFLNIFWVFNIRAMRSYRKCFRFSGSLIVLVLAFGFPQTEKSSLPAGGC